MNKFKALFGINNYQVRKTCILMPVIYKPFLQYFKVKKLIKGFPYAAYSTKELTIIHTLVGPAFLGDCVLNLKGSSCKNLILFGSCGAVKKTSVLKIGSLVAPKKCYEMESFSQVLKGINKVSTSYPDKQLTGQLKGFKEATCATIGSIKLEKSYSKFFSSKNIDILDMECSAFFNAAKNVKKKATALLFISDIISGKSPFQKRTASQIKAIEQAQIKGAETIKNFLSLIN